MKKRSIKSILSEYDFTNFGFEYKTLVTGAVEVTSFWGSYDTYQKLTNQLKREGYAVFS